MKNPIKYINKNYPSVYNRLCKIPGGKDALLTLFGYKLNKGKISKLVYDEKNTYFFISLHKEGVRKKFLIHSLILRTFVGEKPLGTEACHFPDPNHGNNCIWNLSWDTRQKNIKQLIIINFFIIVTFFL